MARYPGALWRPVRRYEPGHSGSIARPMSRYDVGADHTFVGDVTSNSAFSHFNTSGNATPHFMFNEDGSVDQYIDTAFMSSALLDGNHRAITWETWDSFPSHWSDGQAPRDNARIVEAKARFLVWISKTHGIPLVQLANSRPTSRGMGWHRQGIDGNFETAPGTRLGGRVDGGEHWSLSGGKTCPTTRRINQFVEETLPRAQQINSGDDVTLAELNTALGKLKTSILTELGDATVDNVWGESPAKIRLGGALASIWKRANEAAAEAVQAQRDVANLRVQVDKANAEIASFRIQQSSATNAILHVIGELAIGELAEQAIVDAVKRATREGTGTA